MIGDIDVLIPQSRLAEALKHLYAAGYQPVAADERLIYRLDWPTPVELHVRPVYLPVARRLLGSEEVVRDATPLNWRGGDCLLPSPTHFVMHNVIHAFVVDFRDNGIVSLRQLFEFVRANRIYGERIDWAVIQQRFDSLGYGSALRGYAVLAHVYFGFQVPPALPISRWAQLQRRSYRIQLEHPAVHFLFSLVFLGRLLRIHARNLGRNPRTMKKLFGAGYYIRIYQKTRRLLISS